MRKGIKSFLQFLPAAALSWTLVGLVEPWLGYTVDLVARSAIAAVVGVLYTVLLNWVSKPSDGRKLLTKDSQKFVNFYVDWYSREGQVHVFCEDLHWLEEPGRERILNQLRKKGSEAHIYLRDDSGDAVAKLRRDGVHFYTVPPTVLLNVKFSLLQDNGHRDLIIRSKVSHPGTRKRKAGVEEVMETQEQFKDQYLLDVVNEFLATLK